MIKKAIEFGLKYSSPSELLSEKAYHEADPPPFQPVWEAFLELQSSKAAGADQETVLGLIRFFRVSLRSPQHTKWFSESHLFLLASYSTVGDPAKHGNDAQLIEEADKCLVNLLRVPKFVEAFSQKGLDKVLLERTLLLEEAQLKVPSRALLRIAAQLCMFLPSFCKLVDESGAVLNACQLTVQLSSIASTVAQQESLLLQEILNTLFCFTVHWGILSKPSCPPNETLANQYTQLMGSCLKRLLSEPAVTSNDDEVCLRALKLLVSCPESTVLSAFATLDPEPVVTVIDKKLKPTSEDTGGNGNGNGNEESVDWIMLPMAALHRCLQLCPERRPVWKPFVFPPDQFSPSLEPGVNPPVHDQQLLGNRLADCLMGGNPAVQHYVGEFLFQVCDETAAEFTRLVGLGKAAGFLVARGLMSTEGAMSADRDRDRVTPEKREEAARLMRQLTAQPEGESDDARAIRVGRALHDLEKANIVKLQRKSDLENTTAAAAAAADSLLRDQAHCWNCFQTETPMQRCSICKLARYCSRDCQKADFRRHKQECKSSPLN